MQRVTRLVRAGRWPAAKSRGAVTLTYDERHRRRAVLHMDTGEAFLLDLPRAALLAEGDGLPLPEGGYVLVRAAPEPLIEVRAASPARLSRIAWHLGNRHLPAEIRQGRILIRPDHVIQAMLEGLGAKLHAVRQAFHPEGGAYAAPANDHGHEHEHGHHHHG